jgi:8-oxo-dGTP pyrophosphatase MutT (NUDIX family)
MVREISAGGVVVRFREEKLWMAAIEPASDPGVSLSDLPSPARTARKPVLALPKGLVDPGEKPLDTALREVREETGLTAEVITKLADIKYTYSRGWGDGARVFKVVSFYLMRYRSGRINQIADAMRVEVYRSRWVPLEDAPRLLAYRGEKQMAERALDYLRTNPESWEKRGADSRP